jgi:hypothetical protein
MQKIVVAVAFSLALPSLAIADSMSAPPSASVSPAAASDVQAGSSSTLVVTPQALGLSAAPFALTYNSTSVSWNTLSGYNASLTLAGNVATFANPTNIQQGWTYTLKLRQDTTGSRLIAAWGSYFDWGAAGTPTLTTSANGLDLISCYADTTTNLLCTVNKGF